ncbi:MAG: cyclic nucleotide-binding/CBS domain-containing protein [Nitrosarchaeum sp.]
MGLFSMSGKDGKAVSKNTSEKTLAKILVKDIMSKQLITAPASTTVHQISKMMEQGIGAVLVKKDSAPIGIITDRDFAIKIAANKYPLDTPVEKIASIPLQTIAANKSLLDAAKQMSSKKIRKLAVVEDTKVVGIITSSDLVNQFSTLGQ